MQFGGRFVVEFAVAARHLDERLAHRERAAGELGEIEAGAGAAQAVAGGFGGTG
ncbi:MAG: hypothetical protein U1F25_07400 [Rubrivivax sp.]